MTCDLIELLTTFEYFDEVLESQRKESLKHHLREHFDQEKDFLGLEKLSLLKEQSLNYLEVKELK
jgi:hypothetical protein